MLRFKNLQFSSGGEFKLCFCDSDLLEGDNAICNGPEDYTIEVGRIHATGLQCLLSNPKMTRGTCESQHYGGLRCYDGDAPKTKLPVEFMGVPAPDGSDWTEHTEMLISFCQHATDEDAAEFTFCDQWRPDGVDYYARMAVHCPVDCAADEDEQLLFGGTVPICANNLRVGSSPENKFGVQCKLSGCTAFLTTLPEMVYGYFLTMHPAFPDTGKLRTYLEKVSSKCDPGSDGAANP